MIWQAVGVCMRREVELGVGWYFGRVQIPECERESESSREEEEEREDCNSGANLDVKVV